MAASPRAQTRTAGFVFLLYLVATTLTEVFTEQAHAGVRVPFGDAASTAAGILANETSFRLGVASSPIAMACYAGVPALFYYLFRPVSRRLALVAAFFALTRIPISVGADLFRFGALMLLHGGPDAGAFSPGQVQALALWCLDLHRQAYSLGIVFEGIFWMTTGYLMLRSTFWPRPLGALFALAGLTYMTFLSPSLADAFLLPVGVFTTLAELAMLLGLLVRGVDPVRWEARASAAGMSE